MSLLEVVLGIDNVIFISILVTRLPPEIHRASSRAALSLDRPDIPQAVRVAPVTLLAPSRTRLCW
ncbi:MAG: hypothetical protein JOZ89_11280 [Gammaproteobacteria bacterium]|nr:hypothetical protein [Gammaproteobacteria bacterium]